MSHCVFLILFAMQETAVYVRAITDPIAGQDVHAHTKLNLSQATLLVQS